MTKQFYWLACLLFASGCSLGSLPDIGSTGIRLSTLPAPLPSQLSFQTIGFAKELINQKEQLVVIGGGPDQIPQAEWEDFTPRFPWTKNIDRNLLFDSTAFYRSPGRAANCAGDDCFEFIDYRDYSWLVLARPVGVAFVPTDAKTDILKPDPGTLVIKTIEKCQVIMFKDSIFRLTDGQGNLYAMHATENGAPTLEVELPEGWRMDIYHLPAPMIVGPFGEGEECYFNIVGDHLGQGYHQYKFADLTYPSER